MKRREFIAGLGATLAAPRSVEAQGIAMRRVGILSGLAPDDPQSKARLAAFRDALAALGWQEGRNLRLDLRFAPGIGQGARSPAAELVALEPDVVLAQGATGLAYRDLAPATPIVFVGATDAVRQGLVESLARPGGTITGFTSTEPSFGPKWLELLREIAPATRRTSVLVGGDIGVFGPGIEAAGRHLGIEVRPVQLRAPTDIDPALTAAAQSEGGGLILPTDIFTATHRKIIIAGASRLALPLVTGNPPFPADGGLLYYGADFVDLFRRAAAYVDRILRGANLASLPVQQPVKFEMVINLRTARALGLTVPPLLLARADEVIE